MLYMPWSDANIFDLGAKWLHEAVDGEFNVPFLGYSWLLMILDVQFQLFVTFALWALFVTMVVHNWQRALTDWKDMSCNPGTRPGYVPNRLRANEDMYLEFDRLMTERVRQSPDVFKLFGENRLRFTEIEGTSQPLPKGFHDFHLHLYFTEQFGKALEFMVEVSFFMNLFLAVGALCVAALAHHYQVAFMYFLPIFVIIGLLTFSLSFVISRRLKHHQSGLPTSQSINVYAYIRCIQCSLYCIFFSFARLLLSSDIFQDYPNVYLSAALGILVILLLCMFVAPRVMKETICMISLPHNNDKARISEILKQVSYWHTVLTCHECGTRQHPPQAAQNKDWAHTFSPRGTPRGETPRSDAGSAAPLTVESGRDLNFR
jgi:hypothetical protein